MTLEIGGRIELASLAWAVDVRMTGLTAEMAAWIEARWRALSSSPASAPVGAAVARIELEAVDRPVGLPLAPRVEVLVTWHGPRRATLTASSVEAELELDDESLVARGRAHAPHARGALESTFRAIAALSLARRHVVVLHASAVASDNGALVFLGPSEAGKTTTARRLGREGWKRIADDMIAIDLAGEPRLHLLPFERSGQWSPTAHADFPPRCVAAGVVFKSRPLSLKPAADPVRAWAAARLALPCAPGDQEAALADFAALCRIPAFDVGVPAAGPLGPIADAMIADRPRKRLDETGPRVHSAAPLPDPTPMPHVFDESCLLNRAPNVAWRVLDGKAVLVAPSSPLVHTLNPVGTFVWELADGRTVSSILEAVVNEFAVTRTQALADVERFVADLRNKNLLTVTGAG